MKNQKKEKERTAELRQKKSLQQKKKFRDEIEEKRWFEGWVVLMANGYGEKRVAWDEKRKRKKKKKRKTERVMDKRQDTVNGGHHVNIFTEMPLKTELWKLKTTKMCYQFP